MICMIVTALTGHYSYPGSVENGQVVQSAPVPHPSTVRGFLEALCAQAPQTLVGEIAYGATRPPRGVGIVSRRGHVEMSSSPGFPGLQGKAGTAIRMQGVETLLLPQYAIAYRGPQVARLQAGLEGRTDVWGVLSLGTSDDLVLGIEVCAAAPEAAWLVPGKELLLIKKSARGYHNNAAQYVRYDRPVGALQEAAWMQF